MFPFLLSLCFIIHFLYPTAKDKRKADEWRKGLEMEGAELHSIKQKHALVLSECQLNTKTNFYRWLFYYVHCSGGQSGAAHNLSITRSRLARQRVCARALWINTKRECCYSVWRVVFKNESIFFKCHPPHQQDLYTLWLKLLLMLSRPPSRKPHAHSHSYIQYTKPMVLWRNTFVYIYIHTDHMHIIYKSRLGNNHIIFHVRRVRRA